MGLSPLVIYGTMVTTPPSITQSKPTMRCTKSVEPSANSDEVLSIDYEQRLATQLKNLNIPFTDDFASALNNTSHVVDAIFGREVLG